MGLDRPTDSPASSSSASLRSHSAASASPITSPDESGSENGDLFQTLDGGTAHDHDVSHHLPISATPSPQFILIIGGLGYIGSHTSLELLKAGFNVVIVDNLSNSFEGVLHRIKKLADDHYCGTGGAAPLLHFHKLDYRSRSMRFLLESYSDIAQSSLEPSWPGLTARHSRVVYQSRIVGVIHFAASKSVVDSISRPLHYYRNNVCGLVSLLELLERYGIRSFVFSSSATIYGTRAESGRPLVEEDLVHHPQTVVDARGNETHLEPRVEGLTSPYARTKYFCEAVLADVAAADPNWRITALRYFNPVGCEPSGMLGEDPRSRPTNLFPVLTQVLTGERPVLDIYGTDYATKDGTPIRDFVHVTDVARGHISALKPMLSPTSSAVGSFRAYNLGSGTGTTVMEAVRSLESASSRKIPLRLSDRRSGDVGFCVASNERAKRELGWEPRETLDKCAVDSWNFVRRRQTLPPEVGAASRGSLVRPRTVSLPAFGDGILCSEPSEVSDDEMCRTPTPPTEKSLDLGIVEPRDVPLPLSPILETAEEAPAIASVLTPEPVDVALPLSPILEAVEAALADITLLTEPAGEHLLSAVGPLKTQARYHTTELESTQIGI